MGAGKLLPIPSQCFTEAQPSDCFRRAPGRALKLGGVDMLLHPVLGYRQKLRFETDPFLLAARESADIVAPVLVLVEELNLRCAKRLVFLRSFG